MYIKIITVHFSGSQEMHSSKFFVTENLFDINYIRSVCLYTKAHEEMLFVEQQ